jgi:hypothetical protein
MRSDTNKHILDGYSQEILEQDNSDGKHYRHRAGNISGGLLELAGSTYTGISVKTHTTNFK